MTTKTILGIKFFSGTAAEAVEAGLRGGLVVVPSAPVLVDMADKPALREAVLGADLAITDSGLMVLMWRLLTGEKLERVSGLEYLKLLLEELKPETGNLKPEIGNRAEKPDGASDAEMAKQTGRSVPRGEGEANLKPEVSNLNSFASSSPSGLRSQVSGFASIPQVSHAGGGVFWIMPTAAARDRNLAWLRSQGFTTTADDCYIAPVYPPDGPLSDGELLTVVQRRHPSHIIIALGGGVQERLGFALKQSLEKAESGRRLGADGEAKLKAEGLHRSAESTSSDFSFQPSAFGAPPLLPATNPVSVPVAAGQRDLKPEEKLETRNPKPEFFQPSQVSANPQDSLTTSGLRSQVSGLPGPFRPGIHCIGAAIGFLSGEQVRIPMWVDYLYLGWLWRSVSAPRRFGPRYWKARRLVWLMIRYREKAPVKTES